MSNKLKLPSLKPTWYL